MMPQLTPTNVFSACWQSSASSGRDRSNPTNVCQTTAIETSSAAEEESPAANRHVARKHGVDARQLDAAFEQFDPSRRADSCSSDGARHSWMSSSENAT